MVQEISVLLPWNGLVTFQAAMQHCKSVSFWRCRSAQVLVSKGKIAKARTGFGITILEGPLMNEPKILSNLNWERLKEAIRMENLLTKTKYTDFSQGKDYSRRLFICMFLPVLMQLSKRTRFVLFAPRLWCHRHYRSIVSFKSMVAWWFINVSFLLSLSFGSRLLSKAIPCSCSLP